MASHHGGLDRDRFELVFADDFTGAVLSADRWIGHYLPHWTEPHRSAARYEMTGSSVKLLIEADQPPWRTEDGGLRVSNIQTGSFSGALDSHIGQHRHRPDMRVRSPQPTRRLWTPSSGLVEITARASSDPTCMLGLWLIGFEASSPEDSGEICLAELFGNVLGPAGSLIRLGVKAHNDPRLTTDMIDIPLAIDASEIHSYAAAWDEQQVHFYVDDAPVRTVEQSISYPLQLMIDLFEFPSGTERHADAYPKSAEIFQVRGYLPRSA